VILRRKNTIITLAIALLFALAIFGGCAKKAAEPGPMDQAAAPAPEPAPVQEYTPEPVAPAPTPAPEMAPAPDPTAFNVSDLVDVFFDFDKADLSAGSRDTLANDAKLLKAASGVKIVVEGHCDERGTNEYNLGLGERRANAVKNYLVSLGISASRIKTISYGEEKAFAMGHNEAAWKQNRRAHFSLQ
jgi:peptidoglycan-associated lipoprotein